MTTQHILILGDARKMSELTDQSVHLIITSPPYWQLKDYGSKKQIGFHDTYQEYINNLNLVWNESFRVLHPGCRLCINIGDQFSRSVYYGRYKVIPIRTEIIRFCETIGLDYMGGIIWQKVTTTNTSGGATIMGSFPYPRNGILKIDYEFILIFKKTGQAPKVSNEIKQASKLTTQDWNQYFNGHWYFKGERQQQHLAMFPLELPHRLIKMYSFIGDVVLDPFLGSGTTSLAAKNLGRNSVGYEIHAKYLPIIKKKMGFTSPEKPSGLSLQVITQKHFPQNFQSAIKKLPYVYSNPIQLKARKDSHLRRFGSKIRLTDKTPSIRMYTINAILSPELIRLNTKSLIRLIGIKEIPQQRDQAIRYLKSKTDHQKVFLRYDRIKYDPGGNRLAYLYLKNKTFVNAHLLKTGFVTVAEEYEYRNLKKFRKLISTGIPE
jgi:DNA modification methylase